MSGTRLVESIRNVLREAGKPARKRAGEWNVENTLNGIATRAAYLFGQTDAPGTAEWARSVAYAVGAQAARKNIPEGVVLRWLQGAYSNVWARLGGLRPGADMRQIRADISKAYHTKR